MSFANSGFNPLAASGLSQLLGIAQSIVPESFGDPSGGYGTPGYGYGGMQGGYGMPTGYGYGGMQGGYGMPTGYGYGGMQGGYGMPTGYGAMPVGYAVTQQTTYQQTYYGMGPSDPYGGMGCPSGMCGSMAMPAQAGWSSGYYPAYY